MLEYPAKSDRDYVRDVEGHRGERKYGVCRDWRSKVEQAGEDAEDGREPNCAQGGVGPFGDVAKVALVRKTFVTTEGIDGPRACLKGCLADEERCEANERL